MKTNSILLRLSGVAALLLATSAGYAQALNRGPGGKLFLSETEGDTEIRNGEKVFTARQATAFDASGTVIETQAKAHDAFVYSNGTGIYVDEITRVEIARFKQQPFKPDRNLNIDAPVEPSVSDSDVFIPHGFVGICTSLLVSGTSMIYSTPLARIDIRGGKVAIETSQDETVVYLLEGDLTVHAGNQDTKGQILKPGERAVVHRGAAVPIVIDRIPEDLIGSLDNRVSIGCNARKTVSFETIEGNNGEGEIVPKPTIPANLPANIVVSPDRLPGT